MAIGKRGSSFGGRQNRATERAEEAKQVATEISSASEWYDKGLAAFGESYRKNHQAAIEVARSHGLGDWNSVLPAGVLAFIGEVTYYWTEAASQPKEEASGALP
jgi:hypothetical protein